MYLDSVLPLLYMSDFCTVSYSILRLQRDNFRHKIMVIKGRQKDRATGVHPSAIRIASNCL